MTKMSTMAKILPVAMLALFQLACSDSKPAEVKAAPAPMAASAASPPPSDHEAFFVASGPLIVEHQVDVAAQRDGVVAEVHAEPGLRVRAGSSSSATG